MLVDSGNRTSEQRTLNPRVRGSSPWRRTRSDLGFYDSRLFFYVRFVSVVARLPGPGRGGLVRSGLIAGRGPVKLLDLWSRPLAPSLWLGPECPSSAVIDGLQKSRRRRARQAASWCDRQPDVGREQPCAVPKLISIR